jgi:hypothetical protein
LPVDWYVLHGHESLQAGNRAMNYFAHGYLFVDDPWFLAGTAVPDWLNVSDRGVRVRAKQAAPLVNDVNPRVAALARGIVRHHADDAWFHTSAAFAELSWQFAARLRDLLGPDEGLRPSFLGHILVEILLDASLIARNESRLDQYYEALNSIDPAVVQATVNRMAHKPAARLAGLLPLFMRERFLSDYADDGKLCYRLNQVMSRVRLPALPGRFAEFLPEARRQVDARASELLTQGPSLESSRPATEPIRSPR